MQRTISNLRAKIALFASRYPGSPQDNAAENWYKGALDAVTEFSELPMTAYRFVYALLEHLVEDVGIDRMPMDEGFIDRLTSPLPIAYKDLMELFMSNDWELANRIEAKGYIVDILRNCEGIDDEYQSWYYGTDEDDEE